VSEGGKKTYLDVGIQWLNFASCSGWRGERGREGGNNKDQIIISSYREKNTRPAQALDRFFCFFPSLQRRALLSA